MFTSLILLIFLNGINCYCNVQTETGTIQIPNPHYNNYRYSDRNRQYLDTTETIKVDVMCSTEIFPLQESYLCDCNCPHTLSFTGFNVPEIPPSAFQQYSDCNLIYLQMNDVGIEKILPGAFNYLTSLKQLYLSKNNLTELFSGVFSSVTNLTLLDLSENQINLISDHFLSGTLNLKVLNLSSNQLVKFNSYLYGSSQNLEILDLSYNRIMNTFNFLGLNNLSTVNISHNNVNNLTGCFNQIQVLNLSHNNFTLLELNNNCSNKNLTLLDFDVSYNKISQIETNFFKNMRNLLSLHLQFNNISALPNDVFSYHVHLRYLDLSHNRLQTFQHGTFERLNRLSYLDLSYNNLRKIYEYIHSLGRLITLNIEGNHLPAKEVSQCIQKFNLLDKLVIDKNNFSCQDLIQILHISPTKVNIPYGDARNVSNIRGIACSESTLENVVSLKLTEALYNNNSSESSFMFDYFNKNFKSSNFYKYLENLRNDYSLQIPESKIVEYFDRELHNGSLFELIESVRNSENSTLAMNKSFIDYFEKDFKNSSFVKYLESFRMNNNNNNNVTDFFKSDAYNYFNKGFKNSEFFKYLESFKNNNGVSEKSYELIDNKSNEGTNKSLISLISFILVILFMMFALKIVKYYFNYTNKKPLPEHVELIQA